MERFSCKTKIISGQGALASLKELKSQRLLLVTDPFFLENGEANRVLTLSGAACTELFSRIVPDPDVALAAEGTALVRQFQPE